MVKSVLRSLLAGALVCLALPAASPAPATARTRDVSFRVTTGGYVVDFRSSTGAITVTPSGRSAGLAIRELPGGTARDLLYSVTSLRRTGATYTLKGAAPWAAFTLALTVGSPTPGLLHFRLSLNPRKAVPAVKRLLPDVQLVHAPAGSLKSYAPAPPIAGTSLFLSSSALGSSVLYLADLTSLGPYFDRTGSGVTQSIFPYPRAGEKGALVGAANGSFGYVAGSVDSLPRSKVTTVVDSYLYLIPGVPADQPSMADTYLKLLGTVYAALPRPSLPAADWKTLAEKEAADLADPSNWVTVGGKSFLRSYVSDTRSSPELITQAGVLAGVRAFEARYGASLPLDGALEATLSSFYDPQYHTVMNGLGHDPNATGESWYFVQNMISLLQLAQLGSQTARSLLLDSAGALIAFAHANGYEFPQTFRYSDWNGGQSGLQPDVAGGYAWLMLGLYDLTKDSHYLDEAKASIAHVAGKGFDLAYETQMSAYTTAAAQRLYLMTRDSTYRGYALLALANLFHATRLWDCTYGSCRKGSGYHTYFGLNPLPWSDYVAMLEQYQAWYALRDYLANAGGEPSYVADLVTGFLRYSPLTMQYAIPPLLPSGAATTTPGEYPNVPRNNLAWHIPLEDLREGEAISGAIGQEIYGAGGPFMFAAYSP
ncbi:MAG: hypothetical protein JOZ41_12625 [Chloroflexi bacterium]|nr:hypothetical protein [Chloroflexota bacterium]